MMYHPIKFGCKKISSSADMVETVVIEQLSPHCDTGLEDSKPIFLHDTLANNVASPYQFWLQKVQQLRRYGPDEHSLEFLTFSVPLISWQPKKVCWFTLHNNQTKYSKVGIYSGLPLVHRCASLMHYSPKWCTRTTFNVTMMHNKRSSQKHILPKVT